MFKVRHEDGYTVYEGRWLRAYVEAGEGGYFWYLSGHEDAWNTCPLSTTDDGQAYRVCPGDRGVAADQQEATAKAKAALAEVERRQTLAWIAGRAPLRWPRSMFKGVPSWLHGQPGVAAGYAYWQAMHLRAQTRNRCAP